MDGKIAVDIGLVVSGTMKTTWVRLDFGPELGEFLRDVVIEASHDGAAKDILKDALNTMIRDLYKKHKRERAKG